MRHVKISMQTTDQIQYRYQTQASRHKQADTTKQTQLTFHTTHHTPQTTNQQALPDCLLNHQQPNNSQPIVIQCIGYTIGGRKFSTCHLSVSHPHSKYYFSSFHNHKTGCLIMINTAQKSACASRPPPPPSTPSKQTTVTRYTTEESSELTELILRYRDVWKDKSHPSALLQKQLWMQFAHYLHSKGWPRRKWFHLRRKGQRMLKKLNNTTINQWEVSKSNLNSPENPSNHKSLSSSNENRHVNVNGQSDSVTENQSSVHQINLPTLTPSPVVTITSKHPTSTLSPPTNHVQPNPPHTTGPKILNAFSTAHMSQQLAIPHDALVLQPTTTTNNNNTVSEVAINRVALLTPLQCVSFGVTKTHTADVSPIQEVNISNSPSNQTSHIPLTATIDLSTWSEDEESYPELSGTRNQANTNDVNDFGENAKDCITSECERTPLSEMLIHKQMKCLDLKIEILQMKKQYWSEKLNSSSKS
ncbi:unnamed protein product [Schistosoma intercalatum]|nr:unnamed protein product [Schistosoma intercalatum]